MENGLNEGRTILVTGATGQQGDAVARELPERGFGVRALTRDPEKLAARELAELRAIPPHSRLGERTSRLLGSPGVSTNL